jgi:hypothetical protein
VFGTALSQKLLPEPESEPSQKDPKASFGTTPRHQVKPLLFWFDSTNNSTDGARLFLWTIWQDDSSQWTKRMKRSKCPLSSCSLSSSHLISDHRLPPTVGPHASSGGRMPLLGSRVALLGGHTPPTAALPLPVTACTFSMVAPSWLG